jgi:hypothetical protein
VRVAETFGAGKKNIWCGEKEQMVRDGFAEKRTNGAVKRTYIDTCVLLAYNETKVG